MFELSPLVVWLFTLGAGAAMFYYGAIVTGILKDPLLARLRRYGDENRPYPICRFFEAAGAWSLSLALMVNSLTQPGSYSRDAFPPMIFFLTAITIFGASIAFRRHAILRESLPRWYAELLNQSSRQERRFIAFAWLKIPRRMRWHLNSNHAAFQVWADTVRISVIYGAFDPDSPWDVWG
ncbi:MAG: hypothetical protein JW966_14375 [Anaerolineae bacterium]|nr:hypothetical protein [Anaerolineae bacterium]